MLALHPQYAVNSVFFLFVFFNVAFGLHVCSLFPLTSCFSNLCSFVKKSIDRD